MTDRIYTVEEARAALPDVATLVRTLADAHARMEERHEKVTESISQNGGGKAHKEFLDASLAAASALSKLDEMSILVRDPATGLIDFPSERDGEQIYLCWRLGEDGIDFWHPPETGFAGRQPL